MMIIFKVKRFSSRLPSRFSSASSGCRSESAPLDPPEGKQNRESREPFCVRCWREDEPDGLR